MTRTNTKGLVAFPLALSCALTLCADVWKDCDGWFNNPVDRNANGKFDEGELIDSRFGGDATSTQHKTRPNVYSGGSVTISVEDVVSACGRKTLPQQKCIRLGVADEAGAQGASVDFPHNRFEPTTGKKIVTNGAYTVLFRYRQDSDYPAAGKGKRAILFNCGCERGGTNSSGFCLALQNDGSDNQLYLYSTSYSDTGLYLTNSVVPAKEGVWTELAMIVRANERKITFGLFQPGCAAVWRDCRPTESFCRDLVPYQQGISTELRFGAYYGWAGHGFKGSLNMAAFWNRALTTNEVFEAFSGGLPSVAKIGFDDAGHEMFAGAGTSVSVKATDQDLREIPSSFRAGTDLSVVYGLDAYQTNLNQVLRLSASSGSGVFAASIDGTPIGELSVSGREDGFLFVPASHFAAAGPHTLTLACTEGAVVIDTVDLGGSWRLGHEDDGHADFSYNRTGYLGTKEDATAGKTDFFLTDGNLRNVKRYITNPGVDPEAHWHDESKFQRLHFRVPPEMAGRARYALTVALQGKSGTEWAYHEKLRILVSLNGAENFAYESRYDSPSRTHVIRLDPRRLVAGENVIECRLAGNVDDAGKVGAYFFLDYYKLQLTKFSKRRGLVQTIR